MKKFTLYKYPKLYFYGALVGDFLMLVAWIGLVMGLTTPSDIREAPVALIVILLPGLFFVGVGVAILLTRKKLFVEFGITSEGIEVYHPSKGVMVFLWGDLKEAGIYDQTNLAASSFLARYNKYICFSKRPLTERDKKYMSETIKPDMLCIEYRDDVIFEVKKYYPISLDVIYVKRWS